MTGEATEYDADDAQDIYQALLDGMDAAPAGADTMTVTGKIEWSGEFHRRNGGNRTVNLKVNDMPAIIAAVKAATAADKAVSEARPVASLKAKGWHAQLSALTASARGYGAAAGAGLSASPRTLAAWLSEDRAPTKANQEKIAQAYESIRNAPISKAHSDARSAKMDVARAVSDALRSSTGVEVRLFNITNIDLS